MNSLLLMTLNQLEDEVIYFRGTEIPVRDFIYYHTEYNDLFNVICKKQSQGLHRDV